MNYVIYPGRYYWVRIDLDSGTINEYWENSLLKVSIALIQHLDPFYWVVRYKLSGKDVGIRLPGSGLAPIWERSLFLR